MHGDDEARISGRRSVDDGARLLIAENSLLRVQEQYATLAAGQEVVSSVLIGAMHKDGTTTPGLVEQTRDIRSKQDESAVKLDAVIADMGDLKTVQADQGRVLAAHTQSLDAIVAAAKAVALWAARGIVGALGLGALHLLTIWWGGIAAFFAAHPPVAEAAAATAVATAAATAIITKGAHH